MLISKWTIALAKRPETATFALYRTSKMKRFPIALFCALVLTGCGYRAPLHRSYIPEVTDTSRYGGVRAGYRELAALLEKDTGLKPTEGNTVALITDGAENWEMITEDVRKADVSVYIEQYIFRPDTFGVRMTGILKEKARAGVDVRIVLDQSANAKHGWEMLAEAEETGLQLDLFHRPVFLVDHCSPKLSTHRDHRKLMLLDGRTAYLGSRNIKDHNYTDWRDADLRITGPAVADLTAVFREQMTPDGPLSRELHLNSDLETAARRDSLSGREQTYGVTLQIVPDAPVDRILPIRNCLEWAILHAQDYFWYYNPYSPPPASTVKALKEAAFRGVDVRWIVPATNDVAMEKNMAESLYKELLRAGIRIYEWQGAMMHAKQYISDDYLMVIGSANLDNLSFFLNYELMAVVYDETLCRRAAGIFRADLERNCREISLEQVEAWPFLRRLRNRLIRFFGGPVG